MDYFLDNWGSFVGVLSLVITIFGFIIAIRRATEARTASREARAAVIRLLSIADLQRAIALIQRLKDLHRDSKWEASLEHYQALRVMMADIDSRLTDISAEHRFDLRSAIPLIVVIENDVDEAVRGATQPSEASSFNGVLNDIQVSLENLASFAFAGEEND